MTEGSGFARCLFAVIPFTSGCALLEHALEDWDHGGGATDAAPRADAGTDAAPPGDASAPDAAVSDGGACDAASPDAGAPDGTVPDGGAACASDLDCPAVAYCARATGQCTARCAADGICVGPEVADVNTRLTSDGESLCFSVNDLMGGSTHEVRSWDGTAEHPSTPIGSGTDVRLFLVADGYCYYAGPEFKRAPLAGGPEEVLLDSELPVARAWLTAEHVWWIVPEGGELALYRMARAAGAVERFASGPVDELWEAGNGSSLVRRIQGFPGCTLVLAPIDDLDAETAIEMSYSYNCRERVEADEHGILYPQYRPVNWALHRLEFADHSQQLNMNLASTEPLNYQVRGGFIYGQDIRDGGLGVPGALYNITYYRVPRDGGGPREQLFAPVPGSSRFARHISDEDYPLGNTFAVLDGKLVYLSASEPRLLVTPIPTEP